jgi:hypothetical protein
MSKETSASPEYSVAVETLCEASVTGVMIGD